MLTRTFKDPQHESRLTYRRAVIAWCVVASLVAVLLMRLSLLQLIRHTQYSTQSNDNRVRIVPLPPTRGLIYDRNGVLLADNLASFHLELIPEKIADLDTTLRQLGQVIALHEEDLARFKKQLARARRFDAVPLRPNLSEEEVARFAIDRQRFPGVDIATHLSRYYPLGTHLAHVLGYVGRIDEDDLARIDAGQYQGTRHIGKLGIERAYESELHGRVGYQQAEVNAEGRPVRILQRTDPQPGKTLHLNIDARLQVLAEAALGASDGAIVAIEPASGGVLALVSKPGYDPNLFVNGISNTDYQALLQDPARPLNNRALRGVYPPGSTLKPFVALAGLAGGTLQASERRYCPGYYTLPNAKRPFRDWKREGHGAVTLDDAIAESCDVYFYILAQALGIDRLHDFLARFGFGQITGIDLPHEVAGLLPSRAWKRGARQQMWYPGETLIAGIGQGYHLATPLQLAVATATLAQRGRGLMPRVVQSHQEPGAGRAPIAVPWLPPVGLSDRNWQAVIDAMVHVVHGPRGTARAVGLDAPYLFAGKTGTAQVFGLKADQKYRANQLAKRLHDHAWFIAFAPAEAPRIALTVLVEHGGSGSAVAAPIARAILDYWLIHLPHATPSRS